MRNSLLQGCSLAVVLTLALPALAQQAAQEQAPFQSRPVVMGRNGAASTPHPLASETALQVLKDGGNAVDAGVAAAAVASVVQPFTSGIGGIGYATVCDAASRKVHILEFSGRTPAQTRAESFPAASGSVDSRRLEEDKKNLLGSLTPGVVAGWEELLKRFGTMSLARVLAPAIHLAEKGFPVSFLLHQQMKIQAPRLAKWPDSARVFLKSGQPYAPGEILRQPELGETLKRVAQHGAADFYRGRIAQRLLEFFKNNGGSLQTADLGEYKPAWLEPISTVYRGYRVYGAPPPSSDAVFLQALNVLSLLPPARHNSLEYIHAGVEATKLERADRLRYFGDPDFTPPIPVSRLISMDYARRQRERIHPDRAYPGNPESLPPDSHTIQLCVVDKSGNAVNLLQTVGMPFGNAAVAGDTGILLNSMLYFSHVYPKFPNAIAPGRRIEMNPLTIMVFDQQDRLYLMLGSPGGKTVIQTVRQMLMNVIDFGMNIQQAIDAPRFLSQPDGMTLSLEAPLLEANAALRASLEKLGHRVVSVPSSLGSGQGILMDLRFGVRMAGSDFRMESYSLAY